MKKSNFESAPVAAGLTRRNFIKRTTLAAGAAAMYFPYVGRVLGANDRINVACVGVNGKGDSDSHDAALCGGNIVAICDADKNNLDRKLAMYTKDFPHLKPKVFQDYRVLLDKMGSEFDAITVSTPDHHHGYVAIRAMTMGKHAFCQKPLVQTVHEARIVRRLAKEKNLATQMGNQGSAETGLRRAIEVIQAGIIGTPVELHVWCNRPVWPQGVDRLPGKDPVPANLNWDLWLGPAKVRPFKAFYPESSHIKGRKGNSTAAVYAPFSWRGWTEFGTGALGDMACHTVNMPFRALKLGYPNVVELEFASRQYAETFPKSSRIRFEFPEREGLPPLKFWWYDGNPNEIDLQPLRPPAEVVREIINLDDKLPTSGALVIGTKGKLFSPDDYGQRFLVSLGGKDFVPGETDEACKAVPESIPRIAPVAGLPKGGGNGTRHMNEWFTMMRDPKQPAYSNFDIAAYLAEVILLGCVALRTGEGKRMEWDGPNMRSPNLPESAQFVKRENRSGWKLKV